MSTACGTSGSVERPRVDAFADEHAGVAAELPVQLIVSDVERDHVACAALQQHVGEAAGRRSDVERPSSFDGNPEHVQRVRQLEAAAADVGMVGRGQFDQRDAAIWCAGLRHHLPVDADLSGEDHGARAFA